ncbi:MAG: iron ABC transporter permease [Spirochaetales bacterium]|nr:iron ABC transporter permease [Spirochaetales bacterium]
MKRRVFADDGKPYSKARKYRNIILNWVTNPYNVLVIASIIILFALVVSPLLDMIMTTFKVSAKDVSRVKGSHAGDFTFYYWNRLFKSMISKNMLYKPLAHSLLIALCVASFSIVLGGVFAWLMVRSNLPGKKWFALGIVIPYMIPSWIQSMAWISIFKTPAIGGNPGFLSYLHIVPPDWLSYGPVAIIIVLTIHYYAYAYILISGALGTINSELEEMGEMLGASKLLIIRKITFPLVMPAALSAFILIFSKSIGTFSVPAYLGLKVGYYTISTMLYNMIGQQQTAIAYAISLVLIAIAALLIFGNQIIIGKRKSYATIGGKGTRSNPIPLGSARLPICIVLTIFIALFVLMPMVLLFLQSLMLKLGEFSFSNLTLHYWIGEGVSQIDSGYPGLFRNPMFFQCLVNSFKIVIVASIAATLIGQILGYIISRGRGTKRGQLVEQLAFIPYLIPSIAFGAMYLSIFSVEKSITILGHKIVLFPILYGTYTLLFIVSIVKNMPFSSRSGSANMLQIAVELEEAGKIKGAGFMYRLRKIVLPLSKSGVLSGFLLIFVAVFKELDLIVLLVSPKTQTLPFLTYSYMNNNYEQLADASAVLMFLLVFFVYWFSSKVFKTDLTKSM